jgi:integrase
MQYLCAAEVDDALSVQQVNFAADLDDTIFHNLNHSQMKISISLKPKKQMLDSSWSNICFRVREKAIDIKVVSELSVCDKYWDMDTLSYKRNSVVPKDEQKLVSQQIAEIFEKATNTFSNVANSDWLRQVIEDVLHPQLAYERSHPYIVARLQEYIDKYDGSANSIYVISDVMRKMIRYHKYRQRVDGIKDFRLFVETITLEDLNDFHDYVVNEHLLRTEYPEVYEGGFHFNPNPRAISETHIINVMNRLCTFLRWCKKMHYTESEAYLQYGCKTPIYGDPFYLTIEERNKLYDADLTEFPKLAIVRDIFVFHCYVGCRVGDLYRLTPDNVKDGFIEYVPQKTKHCQTKTVRVPLHDKAAKILEKYSDQDSQLFPFIRLTMYNKRIKELLKHCGIDRMVTILDTHGYKTVQKPLYEVATSHTARKTFVGNLYKQVPDPNLIASMSGHVEGSRAFKRYRTIDDDMKRKLVDLIN